MGLGLRLDPQASHGRAAGRILNTQRPRGPAWCVWPALEAPHRVKVLVGNVSIGLGPQLDPQVSPGRAVGCILNTRRHRPGGPAWGVLINQ